MKFVKPINILYELGLFFILNSLIYLFFRTYFFNIICILITIIPFVYSITLRGRDKYPNRINISNFLFGFIATIISIIYFFYFGNSPKTPIVEGYIRDILNFFIFPVFSILMSCIIGLLAMMLGWMLNKIHSYFQF